MNIDSGGKVLHWKIWIENICQPQKVYEEKIKILRKRIRRLPQGRERAGTKKLKLRCKRKRLPQALRLGVNVPSLLSRS